MEYFKRFGVLIMHKPSRFDGVEIPFIGTGSCSSLEVDRIMAWFRVGP